MMEVYFYGVSLLCHHVYYIFFHDVGVQGSSRFFSCLGPSYTGLAKDFWKEKCCSAPSKWHNPFAVAISVSERSPFLELLISE